MELGVSERNVVDGADISGCSGVTEAARISRPPRSARVWRVTGIKGHGSQHITTAPNSPENLSLTIQARIES